MNEYEIEIAGIKHTVLLSDEAAKKYGDAAKPVSEKTKTPANKSRKPANKASSES
jgi:hypothetical protein